MVRRRQHRSRGAGLPRGNRVSGPLTFEEVRDLLAHAAAAFAAAPRVRKELGEWAPGVAMAASQGDLPQVSSRLRAALCHVTRGEGFDSGLYWGLIDSVNFHADTVDDRWKYLTDEDRQRYLRWSQTMAQEAVQAAWA